MQNKDMEDRLRDTLKDYPSSLDKAKMYQDFEKIYGKKSKDKFALIFIFFGVMVIGTGFWIGQNRTIGSTAFSALSGNGVDIIQEVSLSEKTIGLPTDISNISDERNEENLSIKESKGVKAEKDNTPIKRKKVKAASSFSTTNLAAVLKENIIKDVTNIELTSNSGLQGSELKLGAIKLNVDGAPTHNKYATNTLPESAISLLPNSCFIPELNHELVLGVYSPPSEDYYSNVDFEFDRSRWGFRASFLSFQDIESPSFIDYQTVDHLFLSFSIQKPIKKNFSIEPTLSYGKYNIYQEGSMNLPHQYDTVDQGTLRGMISDNIDNPDTNTMDFDKVSYGIRHDLYALDLGLNLVYQLHLGKNWFLETAIGPKLAWNIKSSGNWTNQSKTTVLEDYGISDSKSLVLKANGRIGFQKLYANNRALTFGLTTQMDLTDRRKTNKSLDKLHGLGLYLGLTAGL